MRCPTEFELCVLFFQKKRLTDADLTDSHYTLAIKLYKIFAFSFALLDFTLRRSRSYASNTKFCGRAHASSKSFAAEPAVGAEWPDDGDAIDDTVDGRTTHKVAHSERGKEKRKPNL